MKLVLASSSKYRRMLLKTLKIPFEHHSPEIDETPLAKESAQALAERLAIQKAKAVVNTYPSHLIIGSDQTASINGILLGKPYNKQQATKQLSLCSGQQVTFFSGLCLLNSKTGLSQHQCLPFQVDFRHLSPQQISYYIDEEQPLDCVGSFKCEGLGIALFEKLSGNDPNILIGLPLIALTSMLRNESIDILGP
ncbi:MAG: nucleoside triphosphate pyrophosphatase [Candidatus Endonucleobacter bathymodioli]|uniref:7-methyl-GTP pyrophosphatase n=1 Tax=Candidatus Endonucleibacter bathymodioli TaxID=539814 RepID=A0AA90SS21_9GAMM|nr:nucleoside triphosphate pyrophosphatase [Candidatus Endonucleobacter bathymodioli]